jgi:regulator of protease activity HflC (stomatin/prohibitin superfamily)
MLKFLAKFFAKYFIPISIGLVIIIIVIGVRFMIIRVEIDQIGVKTVVWGLNRGVVQQDFKPGWHRYIRQTETWDLYDATVQTFNFTREARTPDGKIESRELPIRTVDDYNVTVDIIIKYQIKRGKAHKIREEIGPGGRYKGFIESDIREISRNILGKMTEKDLYDPDQKRRRAEEAKQLLSSAFESRHINIIDFLILDMRFDPQLERKIKNVKLAELDEVLNISKERAVNQRGITQTIDATTEALAEKIQSNKDGQIVSLNAGMVTKVTTILADANKFLIEKKAEGDLYKEERRAAGELLIARAKAEGERLRRKAMTGGGGDIIIALEAARNINLDDVVVSTQDIDLLDLEKMIIKFGGTAYGKKSLETEEKKEEAILRKKSERENFFKIPRRMPGDLKVPEDLETEFKSEKPSVSNELETEFKDAKPEVEEELQKEIKEEWKALTEEYPVSQ